MLHNDKNSKLSLWCYSYPFLDLHRKVLGHLSRWRWLEWRRFLHGSRWLKTLGVWLPSCRTISQTRKSPTSSPFRFLLQTFGAYKISTVAMRVTLKQAVSSAFHQIYWQIVFPAFTLLPPQKTAAAYQKLNPLPHWKLHRTWLPRFTHFQRLSCNSTYWATHSKTDSGI